MKKFDQWKLLADLNISHRTVHFLLQLGIDIRRVDKSVHTDEEVVKEAEKESRVVLTFDKDFGEIYYFHKEKKITVIVLSIQNQTAESVTKVLKVFFENVAYPEIKNKLVIIYEGKYRLIS